MNNGKSSRVQSRAIVAAICLLISACGGGGSDPGTSVFSDSDAQTRPSPVPSPGSARAPAADAGQVSGSAVVRVLAQSNFGIAIKDEAGFAALEPWSNRFSSVRTELNGIRLTNESGFYLPADTIDDQWTMPRRTLLEIDVATDAVSAFTFKGSGKVTTNTAEYALSAGQQSIPPLVQLRSDLIKYTLPAAPGSAVRVFAGTAPREDSQMRVCWKRDARSGHRPDARSATG
ncbi:MAG: hypothetical protein R3E87_20460 [Burkholderiaceae bacterium]